jgi:hypothetical protein
MKTSGKLESLFFLVFYPSMLSLLICFSFLNCGNNSIGRYIWANLYAKLFLPPPTGRGYPRYNIYGDIDRFDQSAIFLQSFGQTALFGLRLQFADEQ